MRFIILLFLLSLYVALAPCRPSQNEDNDRQTGEVEYDAGENGEEYFQEENEPVKNEPLQRSYEDHDDSQNEEENDDSYSEPNSETTEIKNSQQFLDVQKMNSRNIVRGEHREKNANEESLPTNKNLNIYKRTSDEEKTFTLKEDNFNIPSEANEEVGVMMYKDYPEQDKKEINNYSNENEGKKQMSILGMNKQSYTQMQENTNERSEKNLDNSYLYDRSRREVGGDEKNFHKNFTNKKDMSEIIDNESVNNKDSKELSRQELEELLSSLSVDKINIVKQILDENENIYKRDITKKSGAVNDDSYAENERFETKQSQGGCHAPDHVHDLPYPKAETTSKSFEAEMNATKLYNDAALTEPDTNKDKSNAENNKNEESLNGDAESKNENNPEEREMGSEKISNFEASYDISNHDNLNNYKETIHADDYSEFEKVDSNILKREVSKEEAPNSCNSIQSLEESFPNLDAKKNTNVNSDLEPLVRVKRTDKKNDIKEDFTYESHKVPFHSENDFLASEEQGETKDYEYARGEKQLSVSNPIQNDNKVVDYSRQKREANAKQINQVKKIRSLDFEMENIGLGSDTDNVLTNIEKIGEPVITSDTKTRNKRAEGNAFESESLGICDTNLSHNRQIIDKGDNLESANAEMGSSDTEVDSFGLFSEQKDINRYKRIRQVNEVAQNREPNN